jgi:twitching motility two-component system response regulator PilG
MAKVLLIDDHKVVLKSLSRFLKDEGHEVFAANDGIEALTFLKNNPDIIFCDHSMPNMNGYQFCTALKTDPKYNPYSKIPIVGIGSFPESNREHLKRYLEKPIVLEDVFQSINDFVQN